MQTGARRGAHRRTSAGPRAFGHDTATQTAHSFVQQLCSLSLYQRFACSEGSRRARCAVNATAAPHHGESSGGGGSPLACCQLVRVRVRVSVRLRLRAPQSMRFNPANNSTQTCCRAACAAQRAARCAASGLGEMPSSVSSACSCAWLGVGLGLGLGLGLGVGVGVGVGVGPGQHLQLRPRRLGLGLRLVLVASHCLPPTTN